jgi:ataxin-3
MPRIYFEQQFAAMCGQHLLNNLLQGNYFDAEMLSGIALQLDAKERDLGMAVDSLRSGSQNVDESGNFSIQVLEVGLETTSQIRLLRDAELTKALKIVDDPSQPESVVENIAFVFNYDSHWYCARYLYHQYWILNSVNKQPEPVSRTMLTAYVSQMQAEGWSVFVTSGRLPPVSTDYSGPNWFVFGENKEKDDKKVKTFQGKGYSLKGDIGEGEDAELMQAVMASLVDYDASSLSKVALEDEPAPDAKEVVMVQLILPPQGKKVRRRFRGASKIEQVFAWANTFSEVSGKLRGIQKTDDRTDLDKEQVVSMLGNACSLRVVV